MKTSKEQVVGYLQNQIAQSDLRARAYVFDEQERKNPNRNAYVKIRQYISAFLSGKREPRWVTIPGIRGVGKTTLLAQLFYEQKIPQKNKLFLSVDQTIQYLGVSLNQVIDAYEDILGTVFEKLDEPVILFLDEIQYEEDWGIILKSVYDRTKNVFILATGSSALSLQTNSDVVRRTIFETLYPMCFSEYLKIKEGKFEQKGLSGQIRSSIFESKTAIEVFQSLKGSETKAKAYWTGVDRQEVDKYLRYGTLPFAVKLGNEGLIYDQIKKLVDRVVTNDIPQMGNFSPEITSKIPSLLYSLAGSEELSLRSLSKTLSLNITTLSEILEVLTNAEMLYRIYPYGSAYKQARKPSKYLFASPAFRSMYFNFIGRINKGDKDSGKLLEDLAGFYLTRFLQKKINTSLTYDSAQGGADFIAGFGEDKIALEIGYGSKDFKQVSQTLGKIKAKYGLSVSMTPLALSKDGKSVSVPLSYFLLI